jgi:hypothetical protein
MGIQTSPDTLAAKAASAAQWGGTSVASVSTAALAAGPSVAADVVFGLTVNQWTVLGILVGMAFAAGGFILSWVYKQKHMQLLRARLDADIPDSDD